MQRKLVLLYEYIIPPPLYAAKDHFPGLQTCHPSGDGACGKTSLLNVFTRGYFPTVYEPTVFENYVHGQFIAAAITVLFPLFTNLILPSSLQYARPPARLCSVFRS